MKNQHTKVAVLVIALILLAASCYRQEPGTVHVSGDSITWAWAYFNRGTVENGTVHAVPGATISTCPENWWTGCKPPPPVIRERLKAGAASTIVLRLGTNDSKDWNASDENAWNAELTEIRNYSEPDACIVIVKPWVREDVHYHAEMLEARAFMDTLPGVHVVDWKPWAQQPNVLGADGVHLLADPNTSVPTQEAADAMAGSIAEAVAACE